MIASASILLVEKGDVLFEADVPLMCGRGMWNGVMWVRWEGVAIIQVEFHRSVVRSHSLGALGQETQSLD